MPEPNDDRTATAPGEEDDDDDLANATFTVEDETVNESLPEITMSDYGSLIKKVQNCFSAHLLCTRGYC